jgi:hypothetical protein
MKRPTLISRALRACLSIFALAWAAQSPAQPSAVETPLRQFQSASKPASESSPASVQPRLSPWAKEILKLTQAGVGRNVVDAFIDNAGVFALGADQIIYLTDLGVPQETIQRMLQHDRDLVSGASPPTIVSEPPYEPLVFVTPEGNAPSPPPRETAAAASVERPATPDTTPNTAALETAAPPGKTTPASRVAATDVANETVAPSRIEAPGPSAPAARKTQTVYPVREAKPVELLPPILFINAHEPQPNLLVIVGFPRS